ncbi:tRNA (guanine(46)-N(7))-methyltransferase TrmB [Sphaerimonospora sp. CA-214678]|uniref:tRNA (guanine(46)-N(7))-methyltransferase TrmB n=1 Tax=Sphaerimonospora sp. CA-214678 TaxID=3240029 RepID=UPI003D8D9E4B
MSAAKRDGLERLWPLYGLEAESVAEFSPQIIDVGFGNGESTLDLISRTCTERILAVDIYRPGVASLLLSLPADQAQRVRIVRGDIMEVLPFVAPETLQLIQVLFPDPWPKRRHSRRRLLRPDTLPLFTSRLARDGVLFVASDDHGYAGEIHQACRRLSDLAVTRPPSRASTKYGRRSDSVYELAWRRVAT